MAQNTAIPTGIPISDWLVSAQSRTMGLRYAIGPIVPEMPQRKEPKLLVDLDQGYTGHNEKQPAN